ncbi:MAG: hypothetical protein R2759_15575 [Bacteroidales bacterium]
MKSNPLNFVNNFSEVNRELLAELKEEIEKGNLEEIKAIAGDLEQNEEKISHHGKRADGIVKSMLQHSRSSSGQKELTDLNTLADEYLGDWPTTASVQKTKRSMQISNWRPIPIFQKINVVPQDIGRASVESDQQCIFCCCRKSQNEPRNYKPQVIVKTEYSPLRGIKGGVNPRPRQRPRHPPRNQRQNLPALFYYQTHR